MLAMEETHLIAMALREYLRTLVNATELKDMDIDIACGEPFSALEEGLNIAHQYSIAVPPLFAEKITAIPLIPNDYLVVYRSLLSALPVYWQKAS